MSADPKLISGGIGKTSPYVGHHPCGHFGLIGEAAPLAFIDGFVAVEITGEAVVVGSPDVEGLGGVFGDEVDKVIRGGVGPMGRGQGYIGVRCIIRGDAVIEVSKEPCRGPRRNEAREWPLRLFRTCARKSVIRVRMPSPEALSDVVVDGIEDLFGAAGGAFVDDGSGAGDAQVVDVVEFRWAVGDGVQHLAGRSWVLRI